MPDTDRDQRDERDQELTADDRRRVVADFLRGKYQTPDERQREIAAESNPQRPYTVKKRPEPDGRVVERTAA